MELTCTSQRDARLLSILRRELALSSGLVKRLKYRGAFTVNGEVAHTDHPVKIGDTVRVMETRPLSHDKRWRLVEIIEKAK